MAAKNDGRRLESNPVPASRRRSTARLRLCSVAFALATLVLVLAPGASSGLATERPAPQLANPTGIAKQLVDRFFALVAHKDRAGLDRFLSPVFQVQRADGSGSGKKAYLANLATIDRFRITQLRATQAGATLVARYLARVEGVVNGKPYTPGPAPRLSVFVWDGERWQLAAHANFNPLTG
jgi:Domain of unknown function (DUF4440)